MLTDEYSFSWNVSGAMEDMKMYFKPGLDIANSDQWPNWKEGTEFKATRDAQRPGADDQCSVKPEPINSGLILH